MSTTASAISQLLDALDRVPVVASALTKGTLIVLIAVCLTRLLGRAPAAARHLVWTLAVSGLLLLPATSLIPWRLELTTLTAARDAFTASPSTLTPAPEGASRLQRDLASPKADESTGAAVLTESALPSRQSPTAQSISWMRNLDASTVLLLAWLAGVVWMLGRLSIGVLNVRRVVRAGVPVDERGWQSLIDAAQRAIGAPAAAQIVISGEAAMPFTYGLARPVIVLPESAEEWTMDRRRSVLLHELAHLKRRDLLTNAIVQVACAVYWFHPLVRFAARRVRIEAERACDALVVAAGMRPSDYAGDLLEIARTMRSSATGAVALAMARRSDFEGRLLAILAPDSGRNALTAARAVLVGLLFAAPAVAIAAAVPASHRTQPSSTAAPNGTRTAVDDSAPTVTESEAAPAPVSPIAQGTPAGTQGSQATAKAQGNETAIPALISVLNDSSVNVRLAAVEALGNLQDPRAIDALVQALRTDTDAKVREAAANSLGEIDSARAVPGLIAALGAERVAAVRAKIAWALGEIDDARAVEALSAAVRDTNVEVRRQVVWAIGEIQNAEGIPALTAAAKDPDAEVRKTAIWGLGETEDKRSLPVLEAAIRDADVEVRKQAVESIGQLDDLKTAPAGLLTALRDDDKEVRKAAAEALGNIEDEEAVPALVPLTRDKATEVKHAAVEALASIGGARVVEVMAALLKDDDPEIRKLAAEALGKKR
jgi:HEAT repeat protein/beta-lactamase regulating signal transducer with metallopeptidase domain